MFFKLLKEALKVKNVRKRFYLQSLLFLFSYWDSVLQFLVECGKV